MENTPYKGQERREFIRLDYVAPIAYKVCREETIHKLLEGYTSNISSSGVLCNIKDKVSQDDILWLSFDRDTLDICHDLEKRCLIYQNGIVGKVIRVQPRQDNSYDVGIQFITREEKNLSHIYPKVFFGKDKLKNGDEVPEEELSGGARDEQAEEEEIKEEIKEDMEYGENEEI